jgi:hypothetical protein
VVHLNEIIEVKDPVKGVHGHNSWDFSKIGESNARPVE